MTDLVKATKAKILRGELTVSSIETVKEKIVTSTILMEEESMNPKIILNGALQNLIVKMDPIALTKLLTQS